MRIIIVTRKTSYEKIIEELHTDTAARFDLKMKGSSIDVYIAEHDVYKNSVELIRRSIPSSISVAQVERDELFRFTFFDTDLIIACGPDGLLINLAQYITVQKVITVNPDPTRVSGVLMLFKPEEISKLVTKEEYVCHELTLAKAVVNDDSKKVVYALGDIFFGRVDQSSAFYNIKFGGDGVDHISSGVIITTGAGSTGWFSSIKGMIGRLSSGVQRQAPSLESKSLHFITRELFAPQNGKFEYGVINQLPLVIRSSMPTGGIVFSDGMTDKGLPLLAGDVVVVSQAERTLSLVRK